MIILKQINILNNNSSIFNIFHSMNKHKISRKLYKNFNQLNYNYNYSPNQNNSPIILPPNYQT